MLDGATAVNHFVIFQYRAELEIMLDAGQKAEIEIISAPRASGPHKLGGPRALGQCLHDKILVFLTKLGITDVDQAQQDKDEDLDNSVKVEEIVKLESPPVFPWW